jgi:hypothetical protein
VELGSAGGWSEAELAAAADASGAAQTGGGVPALGVTVVLCVA